MSRVGANAKSNVNIGGPLTRVSFASTIHRYEPVTNNCTCKTSHTTGGVSPVTNVGQVHQSWGTGFTELLHRCCILPLNFDTRRRDIINILKAHIYFSWHDYNVVLMSIYLIPGTWTNLNYKLYPEFCYIMYKFARSVIIHINVYEHYYFNQIEHLSFGSPSTLSDD